MLAHNGGYYSTLEYDTEISDYRFDRNIPGKLIITEYYPAYRFIKGTFEMNLKEYWSSPVTGSNILELKNGNFEGRIRRY